MAEKIASALKDGPVECPHCGKEMLRVHWELIKHEKMYNYHNWDKFHTGEFSGYFASSRKGQKREYTTNHKYYCGECEAEIPYETGRAVVEESMKVQRRLRRRRLEDYG